MLQCNNSIVLLTCTAVCVNVMGHFVMQQMVAALITSIKCSTAQKVCIAVLKVELFCRTSMPHNQLASLRHIRQDVKCCSSWSNQNSLNAFVQQAMHLLTYFVSSKHTHRCPMCTSYREVRQSSSTTKK